MFQSRSFSGSFEGIEANLAVPVFFSLEKSGIAGTESEKEKEGEDKDEKRDAAGDKDAAKKDEEMEVNYDFR